MDRNGRASALGRSLLCLAVFALADGSVGARDYQQAGGWYRLATEAPTTMPTILGVVSTWTSPSVAESWVSPSVAGVWQSGD